jgi:subtilase family serine protease
MRLTRSVFLPGLALAVSLTVAPISTTGGSPAGVGVVPMIAGVHLASTSGPPTTAQCEQQLHFACYSPVQIEQAYNLAPLYAKGDTGKGRTIVLVDSFGSPTIGHDLAVFDKTFGLPAPPSFTVLQPDGPVPPGNTSWAAETTLDVTYSHAIAPGANIVLVETPVAETEGVTGFPQIVKAENYVIDHGLGDVISQSFGATEQTFPSAQAILGLRSAYVNAEKHHVTVLASSGDTGASNYKLNGTDFYLRKVIGWPASDPLVTAVGGTELHLNAVGDRTSPDTAWNDTYNQNVMKVFTGSTAPSPFASSGGTSSVFSRPTYQDVVKGTVGDARGMPDISMSASCSGSVLDYLSFVSTPGWYFICGTSEASPEFAGIVAIADQVAHTDIGLINPDLYLMYQTHAAGIVDVAIGNNTVTFTQNSHTYTVNGYSAMPPYDLVTGYATVNAAKFVPELASFG